MMTTLRGQISLNPVELWEYFRQRRLVRRNLRAVLRLLYLECLSNVELLKSLADGRQKDEEYFALIDQLDTNAVEFLFLEGESNTAVFRVLSRSTDIVYEQGDLVSGHRVHKDIHLIHVIIFIYVKIQFLRKYAAMRRAGARAGHSLKKVRVRTRLENVRANCDAVVKVLEADKEFRRIQVRRFLG